MTDSFLLDWLTLAVSLFNTILLFWLGLTVLLNAERRTTGIYVTSLTLLLGGAFFISHSAILGIGITDFGDGLNFWLRLGFIPIIAIPFAWYVIMLWYAGFWDKAQTGLRKKHRTRLILISLMSAGIMGLFIAANPVATIAANARYDPAAAASVGGIPLIVIFYPLYIVLCIASSLNVLRYPNPSQRMMGDLARRRARPWLTATALVLLVVTFLVTAVMLWVTLVASHSTFSELYAQLVYVIAFFDFIISALIGVAILLVGQAVVAYEVFTGKTLPSSGLAQQWRNAMVLALGFSGLVSFSLTLHVRPIYTLLIGTFLTAVFYALFSWRTFAERETYMQRLRPFVASQNFYDTFLSQPETLADNSALTFNALCADVLDTKLAFLIPLGASAELANGILAYPAQTNLETLTALNFSEHVNHHELCFQVEPTNYKGASWGVPLWSERGLNGMLLLGEKKSGGLYAQEEIEIARMTGERLIDVRVSNEIARRLLALQRDRLAESQVMDRQTRRSLHDEVLPTLHTALLTLDPQQNAAVIAALTSAHRQISNLLRGAPTTASLNVAKLGLLGALRESVETELERAFDRVTWEIDDTTATQLKGLPPLTAEVIFCAAREALRNAARYGRGAEAASPLQLSIQLKPAQLIITDNGVGVSAPPQTKHRSGQGLSLHSTMMAIVGGALTVESEPQKFTRVSLRLPDTKR